MDRQISNNSDCDGDINACANGDDDYDMEIIMIII